MTKATRNVVRGTKRAGRGKLKAQNILSLASVQTGFKKDSEKGTEIKPESISIKKPSTLIGKEASAEWDRVIVMLRERKMISDMYVTALVGYCNAYGLMMQAARQLNRLGPSKYVQKSKDGNAHYQTQWLGIYNKAEDKAYRYSALFGFSPNDDMRMKAGNPGKPATPHNAFDDI